MSLLLTLLMSCAGSTGIARGPQEHAAGPDAPATSTDDPGVTLTSATCLQRLDDAVRLAERGDTGRARLRLERLAPHCEHLPQIHHDLGVIAARAGRTRAALEHFETALEADPRAAMTLAHARALHRLEAAAGYARALGRTPATVPPAFTFQRSDDVGADTLHAASDRADALRDVATLEYELYAWWRSGIDGDTGARLAHYVEGYPRATALAGRERDATLRWADVRREIAFTAEDAVAVLEHPGRPSRPGAEPDEGVVRIGDGNATDGFRRLLLLRLQGDRWRIYRDAPL